MSTKDYQMERERVWQVQMRTSKRKQNKSDENQESNTHSGIEWMKQERVWSVQNAACREKAEKKREKCGDKKEENNELILIN